MSLFGKPENRDDKTETVEERSLRLRKEELDIAKNRVQTGEVVLGKEVVEEHKRVDVPVTHEEVIIERRSFDNEFSEDPILEDKEVIRIPVTEEKVEVGKHTVLTGEISARKREVEETRRVDETLKREEARINKVGDANIVGNESDEHLH